MHDIIKTLFTRSWWLALAGAAVIGAQPVSAQTAADSKHDRTVRSRIALARKMNRGEKTMKTQERTETIRGFVGGYPTIGRKVYEDGESTSYAAENIEFGQGVITIIRGLASIFRDCFGGLHRFVEVTI